MSVLARIVAAASLALPGIASAGTLDLPISGHRVVIEGASLSMLGSNMFVVDGVELRVFEAKIFVNGEVRTVPRGAEIRIVSKSAGNLAITSDGRPL
jgi:hypothetical protein